MQTIQIRLEKAELEELERMRRHVKRSRSDVTGQALAEGLKVMRREIALDRYSRQEISLAAAAEFAGVSIAQMADASSARGIPYFRYSAAELEEDLRRIRGKLK